MSLGVPLRRGTTSVKAGQNIFHSQTMIWYESDNTTNEKGTPLVERGSELPSTLQMRKLRLGQGKHL